MKAVLRRVLSPVANVPLTAKIAAGAALLTVLLGIDVYMRLSSFVDTKLHEGTLTASTVFYSAPRTIETGDETSPTALAHELQLAGYTEATDNPVGYFQRSAQALYVAPGRSAYFRSEPAEIRFHAGRISEIVTPTRNGRVRRYNLEPQALAAVAQGNLGRSRKIRFPDIPQVLVNAILSAEDKHFFRHAGFDAFRVVKAAAANIRSGRRGQGGSTITMQLARNIYLDADKLWKRKITELLIAIVLEIKLSKQEILENYANHVYLGRASGMDVRGFAQASETYLGRRLKDVSLAEAALLAGVLQRPTYLDPIRHTDRAIARRNVVLRLMQENGYITASEYGKALAEPVRPVSRTSVTGDAPWFLDLAIDQLDTEHSSAAPARVYTTLDPDLQRSALDAVSEGLSAVDAQLRSRRLHERPQVALVALDSRTGEVKALVGGRDFSSSQFNHATAMRQPGSVFKPFVYASALEPRNADHTLTAASTVADIPRSFNFDGQIYEPSNHGAHFYGTVTLRMALAKSMNIAAVSVAEKVGYKQVLELSRRAGLNDRMRATPSLALGAYEATPLEMAAAYTIFANRGRYVAPSLIREVRSARGELKFVRKRLSHRALSREAAFIMQDMLEEVLRSGTAASARHRVRGRAAGKTGTSRDGWFVGYTSNLICAVWVGFDSNRDLDLEGARSAMPVWAAFMRAAGGRSRYREEFDAAPNGVTVMLVDTETGLPAGPDCPLTRREYFIAGTEPASECSHEVSTEDLPTIEGSSVVPGSDEINVNSPSDRGIADRAPLLNSVGER